MGKLALVTLLTSFFDLKTNAMVISCGIFMLCFFSDLNAQNTFEEGQQFFETRAASANSHQADSSNINKAISAFQQSIEENNKPEQSAAYLLQSYYFKAMFTGMNEDRQKDLYDKGRTLGEQMMERYPKSVPIKFWYGANIGRWAKVYGFTRAAINGIAQKLRRVCNDIIRIDSGYQGGGGYRILAQVHFYSPNIPLLMGWPSDKKALSLVEKAIKIAPNHPTNRMLYAQILVDFDRNKEAREHLIAILEMSPRPNYLIEDRYVQHRSQELLNEHF